MNYTAGELVKKHHELRATPKGADAFYMVDCTRISETAIRETDAISEMINKQD